MATFPSEFSINQSRPNVLHGNIGKIEWGVGLKGESPVVTGTDVVFVENGKVKSFYVFLNKE